MRVVNSTTKISPLRLIFIAFIVLVPICERTQVRAEDRGEFCFAVYPDFSCWGAQGDLFRQCLQSAYNDAFEGMAWIEETLEPYRCMFEEGASRRDLRRQLMKKKKKGNSGEGKCKDSCQTERLPSDCFDCKKDNDRKLRQRKERRLGSSTGTFNEGPNKMFIELFHDCLCDKFPTEMQQVDKADMYLEGLSLEECPELADNYGFY